jgi:hypothetical protein
VDHLFCRSGIADKEEAVLIVDVREDESLADTVEHIWGTHPNHLDHASYVVLRLAPGMQPRFADLLEWPDVRVLTKRTGCYARLLLLYFRGRQPQGLYFDHAG